MVHIISKVILGAKRLGYFLLSRAPLGYSTERATLGGGHILPIPNGWSDGKNGKRKLSLREILGTPRILLKEVRDEVKGRSHVKTTGFHIVGFQTLAQR